MPQILRSLRFYFVLLAVFTIGRCECDTIEMVIWWHEGSVSNRRYLMASVQVNVDRQGRVVIPLRERERLGVTAGGRLELISTSEGVLLERRRPAAVRIAADGIPLIVIEDSEPISNEKSIEAIHRDRERE